MNYVTTNTERSSYGHVYNKLSRKARAKMVVNPVRVFLALVSLAIVTELIFTGIVLLLSPESIVNALLINSVVLIVCVIPALYCLVYRPVNINIREFRKSEEVSFNGIQAFNFNIEDIKRVDDTIIQHRQDWENTFDALPDAITVHDRNHNIIKANKAAREILNLPFILEGRSVKCYTFYHSANKPPDGCMSCKCFENEEMITYEIFEPHLNKFLEIIARPSYDSDGRLTGVVHIARDISYKKESERTIQEQIKRLSISNFIDKAIAANLNLNSILHILTDLIIRHIGIDAANVLLLDPGTQLLQYKAGKGFRSDALKYTKLKLGESNAGRAAIERRTIIIHDLKKEPMIFFRSEHFDAEEFVSYVAMPLIAKDEVKGVLELFHRSSIEAGPEWIDFLDSIANQAAVAIDNATMFEELQGSRNELMHAYDSTIAGWSHALDMRDKETEGHSRRVAEMTVRIAREVGIRDEELDHINRGAYLHDIGKMAIPDSILLKPARLTEEERKTMELHTIYAHDMLRDIHYLQPAIDIPLYHHEKWDGTGYPRGLKGRDIPLAARIFATVDVWDALSSDRPYRNAWPEQKVIDYICSESGTHFDPEMVDIFMKVLMEGKSKK